MNRHWERLSSMSIRFQISWRSSGKARENIRQKAGSHPGC